MIISHVKKCVVITNTQTHT